MWNNIQYDYAGIKVLITGGTSGLGLGVAEAYRDAGAAVTITGTRPSLADYPELSDFDYLQLDVENNDNIDQVAAAIDTLDVLIHSAGLAFLTLGLDEYEPEIFNRAIQMHLSSVYRLSSKLETKLSNSCLSGGGAVICMASMSSYFGIEAVPAYGAAKTGLLGLVRVLAVHWAKQNIRINAIAAGMVQSRMTTAVLENAELSSAMLARVPLGRHGVPADISGAALFLSSDAASWITGQTLPIDGGYSIAG